MPTRFLSAIAQLSAGAREAALELIFPAVCRLCDAPVPPGDDFCCRCETALMSSERMMKSACWRCGRPGQSIVGGQKTGSANDPGEDLADGSIRPPGLGSVESAATYCQRCKDSGFHFDQVITLWAYLDRVRDAVVAAKYVHQSPLGDALGRRLARQVLANDRLGRPEVVTFIPSHFTRQFSRGGNSNQTIATAVATGIGSPCKQLLRITRAIAKQAWLDEADRTKNVRGAFALKKSYAFPRSSGWVDRQVANRHILVVDDVLTTGATANEVASVFKHAGASRVTVAVVARAVS